MNPCGRISAIYNGCGCHVGDGAPYDMKISREISGERCGRFDFEEMECTAIFDNQIDFSTMFIAYEIQVGRPSGIESRLKRLHDYHVLEEASESRVANRLVCISYAKLP